VTLAVPDPRRILVIHVTRIGDTLMTTPALRAIRYAWPDAHITFLGHPKRAEVIEHLPFVNEVGAITKHTAWLRSLSGRASWDLGFVYGYDRGLVRFGLRSCKQVVAFRQNDAELDSRISFMAEAPAPNTEHGVDQLLRLPKLLGALPPARALAYASTQQEIEASRVRMHAAGVPSGGKPLVGLVIESFPTKPYRDWDVSHFAELAERVRGAYPDAHFVLLGGRIAPGKIHRLKESVGEHLTVLAGKLKLRETAAVMAQLDLYVGVDTGPTHLAGALQVPMVAMYHCKHPARFLAPPEHPRLTALEHPDLDTDRCTEHSSLSKISVDTVWQAVQQRLQEQSR
jgi:heptosyltransferase-3